MKHGPVSPLWLFGFALYFVGANGGTAGTARKIQTEERE